MQAMTVKSDAESEPGLVLGAKRARAMPRACVAISIGVRNGMGIALMSLVKQQPKAFSIPTCERWIFRQR